MPPTTSVYSAAPDVRVGPLAADALVRLIESVTVVESTAGLGRCEVRLSNWGPVGERGGYLLTDRSEVDFGADVEIAVGSPDERSTIFTGRLTAIEGDYPEGQVPSVVLLAEDHLQDLRMTRRTRTFEQVSDAEVVRRIAGDHGLTPEVDLPGPTHAAVCQLNQSDLALLRDRALPHGADVWIDGRTLHVGRRADDPVVLRYGAELLAFRALADVAHQATEQRVAGWDPELKEAVLERVGTSAIAADLGADSGGGQLLEQAFGSRPATTTMPGAVTRAQARAMAEGLYRERARRFVTGVGVADGLALLRAGRAVEMQRLGGMFDGTYRLSSVVHRYDIADGYRTEIEVERGGVGG